MPNYYSSNWNEQLGACVLHGVPTTPCPCCLADKNKNVRVCFTEDEKMLSKWDDVPLIDHLPIDSGWLLDKIM